MHARQYEPEYTVIFTLTIMRPLDGTLVLDFSRVLSGPFCTMQLADLGARVIKIEQPGRGDDTRAWGPPFIAEESTYFLSINRNKESLAINLKDARARTVIDRLLAGAEVGQLHGAERSRQHAAEVEHQGSVEWTHNRSMKITVYSGSH